MRGGRDQNLAAQMAALLLGRELILEVNARGARLDIGFHDLECVERSAESGFRVREDRREPGVDAAFAFGVLDLIGALERAVDLADKLRAGIGGIKTLIGIHRARGVGVGGNLPARQVDRFEPGAHHLHRLVARQSTQRRDESLRVKQVPKPVRAAFRQRVILHQRAAQAFDIGGPIGPLDAVEAAARGGRDQIGNAGHVVLRMLPSVLRRRR